MKMGKQETRQKNGQQNSADDFVIVLISYLNALEITKTNGLCTSLRNINSRKKIMN
jgi:hypothetical protein